MSFSTDKPSGKLVLLGEENSGRDEMNLAGNPFALLQSASKAGQPYILNEWKRELPDGKIVTATWNVKGDALLGLPGPIEERLYLVLLQLTREAAGEASNSTEWPQKVWFSRYDVLTRMRMGDRGRQYVELKNAFNRLQAVSIQTEHSFYNPLTKKPHTAITFSILNEFALNEEPRGRKTKGQISIPNSWFEWNKTVHGSFLAGNVRSLSLDFAISLTLPTALRLFRYLDMMRGATTPPRREFTIGIHKLRENLGMSENKYASKIKQNLEPAINELIEREYLREVEFQKGKNDLLAVFRFASLADMSRPVEPPMATEGLKDKPKKPIIDVQATIHATTETDVRADALKCAEVFRSLGEAERLELMELAKAEVSPIWHDRVGQPESPMSLGLWKLVADRYPERVK